MDEFNKMTTDQKWQHILISYLDASKPVPSHFVRWILHITKPTERKLGDQMIEVLRNGQQCDEDGVMCIVSRQACHEAADEIERLRWQLKSYEQLGGDADRYSAMWRLENPIESKEPSG
jgi:hypothetical protein